MTSGETVPIPPRWHRALTPEDVETARGVSDLHAPTGVDPNRPVCASATHLVVPPRWPCQQRRWADWVLSSEAQVLQSEGAATAY
jgi:hypothetical protein